MTLPAPNSADVSSIRISDAAAPAGPGAAFEFGEQLVRTVSLTPTTDIPQFGVDGLADALVTSSVARTEATTDLTGAARKIREDMRRSSSHDVTAALAAAGEQRAASLCAPTARVVALIAGAIAKSVTERDEHASLGVELVAPPATPNPLRELPDAPPFVDPPPFVSMDAALRLDRMRGALCDMHRAGENIALTRLLSTAAAGVDAFALVALETLPRIQRDEILASLVRESGKVDVLDCLRRTYWRAKYPEHFARRDGLQLLAQTVAGSARSASSTIRAKLGGGLSIIDDVERVLAPLRLPLTGRPLA